MQLCYNIPWSTWYCSIKFVMSQFCGLVNASISSPVCASNVFLSTSLPFWAMFQGGSEAFSSFIFSFPNENFRYDSFLLRAPRCSTIKATRRTASLESCCIFLESRGKLSQTIPGHCSKSNAKQVSEHCHCCPISQQLPIASSKHIQHTSACLVLV